MRRRIGIEIRRAPQKFWYPYEFFCVVVLMALFFSYMPNDIIGHAHVGLFLN